MGREETMRVNPYFIGLAVFCALAAGTASAQQLNYTSQSDVYVNVEYANLPANTQLFLLNRVSGGKWAALVPMVSGSGSMAVPLPSAPGDYSVLAEQAGDWVAQTVTFYVPEPQP
jgi:hypothetical protein